MTEYVRFYSGEWSGLYVDGKLVRYGDHYIVDEHLMELLDVKQEHNDAWLSDGNSKPFPLLADVRRKEVAMEERAQRAEAKREQARALLREADELENDRA